MDVVRSGGDNASVELVVCCCSEQRRQQNAIKLEEARTDEKMIWKSKAHELSVSSAAASDLAQQHVEADAQRPRRGNIVELPCLAI